MANNNDERHSIWIRIFHWINAVSILLLIFTGFQIHAPWAFKLFGTTNAARMIHFIMAYILCASVVCRVYYAIVAHDAKNIVFEPVKDTKKLPSMMKYYLFMTDSHPDYGKYNPGQKAMYTGWLVMVILMAITGFILYKPTLFMGLANALGGLVAIRMAHYIINWLFVLSVLAHVYLDVSEGIPVLKSMFTGKLEEESHHSEEKHFSA
jgi:Ni/Fe-hydrogenase 1 B-type cytochrome subunit